MNLQHKQRADTLGKWCDRSLGSHHSHWQVFVVATRGLLPMEVT